MSGSLLQASKRCQRNYSPLHAVHEGIHIDVRSRRPFSRAAWPWIADRISANRTEWEPSRQREERKREIYGARLNESESPSYDYLSTVFPLLHFYLSHEERSSHENECINLWLLQLSFSRVQRSSIWFIMLVLCLRLPTTRRGKLSHDLIKSCV